MISETIILDDRDQNILQGQIINALSHQGFVTDVNYINESVIDITVEHGGLYASVNIERNVYKPEIVVATVQDYQLRKRAKGDGFSLGDAKGIRKFALFRGFGLLSGIGFLFVLFAFPEFIIPYATVMIMISLYVLTINLRKLRKKPKNKPTLNYKNIVDSLRSYLVDRSSMGIVDFKKCWNCFEDRRIDMKYCENCGKD